MKFSKNYLKMCRKADEIHTHWELENGSYFYGIPIDYADENPSRGIYQYFECEDEYYSVIPRSYDPKLKEFTEETDIVRLPLQNELQKMINFEHPLDLLNDFTKWCNKLTVSQLERHQTLEEMWIGYVMYVNYQKVWNGRNWERS